MKMCTHAICSVDVTLGGEEAAGTRHVRNAADQQKVTGGSHMDGRTNALFRNVFAIDGEQAANLSKSPAVDTQRMARQPSSTNLTDPKITPVHVGCDDR